MHASRLLPDSRGSNGWWEDQPAVLQRPKLEGSHRVKTAILGGGICGVSTAHRLGELCPDDEIALVEAEQVGYGASGRNAGFMLNVHSHGPPKNIEILQRNIKLWESGLNDLRNKVQQFQIQCDWSEFGRYYGAAGSDGEKHLTEIAATLDVLGHNYSWISATELKKKIGTSFYNRGLHAQGSALANPAALLQGLARHLPANVSVYENSAVIDLQKTSAGFTLKTQNGELHADRLVLAAGVFLEHFGIGKRQFVPMATYASMTAPLTDAELAQLGEANEFGLLGGSANGSTIRLTKNRRLFIRNYYHFHPGAPASEQKSSRIYEMHRRAMLKRWPGLKDTAFTDSWGGVMAFTNNNGALFGEFEPNLFVVLTNDVSPMTRGAASGALLAELMEGQTSELLKVQQSIAEASHLPPRPFLDIGIALKKSALHFAAKNEF